MYEPKTTATSLGSFVEPMAMTMQAFRGHLAGLLLGAGLLAASTALAEEAATDDTPTEQPPAKEEPVDVATILSGELTTDDYVDGQMCINPRDLDKIEVLDESLVLFHGRRGEIWLNQLSSQCLGLDADMMLDIRSYGGNFCRLDRFRGTSRFDTFLGLTAECRLGTFERIEEPHAEALRTAAAERRQANEATAKTKRGKRRERAAAADG